MLSDEDRQVILGQADQLAEQARGLVTSAEHGLQEDASFVFEVEALRLTILASCAPPYETMEVAGPPAAGLWARVELFGHSVRYAEVLDTERFGRRWLELVEPAMWKDEALKDGEPDVPEKRKLYHPNAVYALDEIGEDEVRRSLRSIKGLNVPRPHDDERELDEREMLDRDL